MNQGAGQTQALDRARGERANLAIEGFAQTELLGELRNPLVRSCGGGMIEPPKNLSFSRPVNRA